MHQFQCEQVCLDLLVQSESCVGEVVYEESIKACVLVREQKELPLQITIRMLSYEVVSEMLLDYMSQLVQQQVGKGLQSSYL